MISYSCSKNVMNSGDTHNYLKTNPQAMGQVLSGGALSAVTAEDQMTQVNANGSDCRPCVLVVEDDDAIRRSLQLLLRGRGFDVRAYASPRNALADRQNRSAVCLIADLVMPGVDGFMLLADLRADGWNGPAILISGYINAERARQATSAGFDAVLEKPLADSRLFDTMRALIAPEKANPDELGLK